MKPGARLPLRIALVLALLAGALWASTQFLYRPWRVVGRSMSPSLEAGDTVWIELAAARRRPLAPGDIVLVRGPSVDRRPLLKRIVRRAEPRDRKPELWDDLGGGSVEWFWIEGTNLPASVDSRAFGAVPASRIVGRVVFRSAPWSRAGPVD